MGSVCSHVWSFKQTERSNRGDTFQSDNVLPTASQQSQDHSSDLSYCPFHTYYLQRLIDKTRATWGRLNQMDLKASSYQILLQIAFYFLNLSWALRRCFIWNVQNAAPQIIFASSRQRLGATSWRRDMKMSSMLGRGTCRGFLLSFSRPHQNVSRTHRMRPLEQLTHHTHCSSLRANSCLFNFLVWLFH